MSTFLEVRRAGLAETRVIDEPLDSSADAVADGEVLLAIGECALTANNITYAAFGAAMRYWDFFPPHDGDTTWGRVPVWGAAEVVVSRAPGVGEGARVYGYFPMGSHLVVRPERVSDRGFVDASAHRQGLPAVYNQYMFVGRAGEAVDPTSDRVRAVIRPLFTTSFLIDDWLGEQAYADAEALVVGSASSKTALTLAHLAHRRGGLRVVGLTSARHADFVAGVGYYDTVVTYDELRSGVATGTDPLAALDSAVYVDMSGDASVTAAVHGALGERLRISCQVGATHWRDVGGPPVSAPLPGPRPQFFFAPDHMHRADGRVESAYDGFVESASWMRFRVVRGADAVADAFATVRDGLVDAADSMIISFD